MAERHGTVLKSFLKEESGMWHLIVQEDELVGRGATASILAEDPGFRPGDRVYRRTGLAQRANLWRLVCSD